MANMRAIRTRIKSLESTQQMTKSMKMVSASKLRRTQTMYGKLSPFADSCSQLLKCVMDNTTCEDNPFLRVRPERNKICYVLFVGNRGLCGAYNQTIFRYLTQVLQQETREAFLVVCGRWGREAILKTGVRVERWFSEVSDTPDEATGRELSEYLKQLYLSGQADEIVLIYQKYTSALVQSPSQLRLLPVGGLQNGSAAEREYIYEPDPQSVLDHLVELYLIHAVYIAMLEAKTSEHSARMTAMTSASDNADELIGALHLKLNHARQAAITTEIAEISGGAAMFEKGAHES